MAKEHNIEENQVEVRNSVARNDDDDSGSIQSQSTSDIPGARRVGGISGEDSVTIVVGSVGNGASEQPQEEATAHNLGIMEHAIEEDDELIEAYKVEEDTAGNSNGRSG